MKSYPAVWVFGFAACMANGWAWGQSAWTDQPIRLIVPASAGGSMDQMARPLAAVMGKMSGQTFIVDNRGGGAGVVAREFVAKAAPDGTVFLLASVHELTRAALLGKIPYPLTGPDFKSIALLASVPNMMVVNVESPIKTVPELIQAAKANPKGLSYGVGSIGNLQHLAGVTFKHVTGAPLVAIPYKGSAPAIKDLIGGQIDLLFETMPAASVFVRDDRLRGLAVTSAQRSPLFPELPTLKELGLGTMEIGTWYGAFAPSALPSEIAGKMATLVAQALQDPEIQRMWAGWGSEKITPLTQAEFSTFVLNEAQRWQDMVRRTGVKTE